MLRAHGQGQMSEETVLNGNYLEAVDRGVRGRMSGYRQTLLIPSAVFSDCEAACHRF